MTILFVALTHLLAPARATPIYVMTVSPAADSGMADAVEVRVRELSTETATGEVKRFPNRYRLVADLSKKAAAQVATLEHVTHVSDNPSLIGEGTPDPHVDPAIQIVRFERGLPSTQLQPLRERIAAFARETESGYSEWFGPELMRAELTASAARAVSRWPGVVSVEEELLEAPGCAPTLANQ